MTPHEARVYGAVMWFLERNGWAPTMEEIREHLGYASRSAVQYHVNRLRDLGYLEGAGRSLRAGPRPAP